MKLRLLALTAALALAACGSSRKVDDATPPGGAVSGADAFSPNCTRCHGEGTNPAPPQSVRGATATTDRSVGAHQAHLQDGPLHKAVACRECHVVPTSTTHMDGVVKVTFGPTASADGAAPTFDPATLTCATYCHGATIGGGTNRSPVWTKVDGTQATCGSCHGLPPPAPHVQNTNCGACHPGYTLTSVAAETHVNGAVDLGGMACSTCHGDPARATNSPAPPKDSKGNVATTALGVGAHQTHLTGGKLGKAVECSECHVVPKDTKHVNGMPQVTFGPLASAAGASAGWDRASATCTTYCHGATLPGGTLTKPVWTKVDGTQAACGTCHGAPPPAPHPQNTACGSCHTGYSATSVNVATHLNGTVDLGAMTCTSCHGDPARTPVANADALVRAAPPVDTKGSTAATSRGVGAHQAHVNQARLRAPLACAECHTVPTSTTHANGTVNVSITGVGAQGVAPSWNGTTCTTYCHGATLAAGGTNQQPSWTGGAAQAACGTCHGAPPPAPHVQNTNCAGCHGNGYSQSAVNPATHMNGRVDLATMSCTSCHGDAARAANQPAPPVDTKGNTSTTARGVGAHQAHLGARIAPAVQCAECHVVPTSTNHSNGVAQVTLAGRATMGGAAATWNGTTCTTYCHGATLNAGGSNQMPIWTGGSPQAACGTCHGAPPPAPHVQNANCGGCHGAGYSQTTVNAATHVNGVVDLGAMTCTSCHGDPSRAANQPAPPVDTKGNTATTARGVGAHQSHLGARLTAPVQCGECHVVPTSTSHSNGVAQVTLGGRAVANGTGASWDGTTCATYCHGATLPGGSATAPVWTRVDGSQKTCGSCHGAPPPSGRHGESAHQNAGCGACHPGYSSGSVNASVHVNGTKDVGGAGTRINGWNPSTRTCSPQCHGSKSWDGGSSGGGGSYGGW